MKVLEIKNLVKSYGSLKAVNDVSFDIHKGEIFGLLGPNGAGKTSLISTVMTLEKINSGQIYVCGYDVQKQASITKSLVGFMPQDIIIHGYFSVREVIKFYSGFCGVWPDSERIDYLLKRMDLWEQRNSKVRTLSGGMKRRLLIVKALVHSPKLLLLDEPTAGVDIQLRASLWEFIKELKEETSILFTTHYLEEAEKLCDRVAFIHKGKIRQIGKTNKLISHLTTRKVLIKLKKGLSINKNKHHSGQNEDNYEVFLLPYSLTIVQLLKDLNLDMNEIQDLKVKEGSLEDVFNSVTEGISA
ncbi:MAG: ABC transporter ATP-binding protein [Bdellovibrionaceae bacterium]|nr:ABC transporter ATP-binding protein [Pseudobdellovibrionaceae bacterium]